MFLSGGDVIEGISEHLSEHLKEILNNSVPIPDTIKKSLKELSTKNTVYLSTSVKSDNVNTNKKLTL